ncbi:MAG: hypothetical protein ACD_47C00159G0001 [uncultured bacterium]|nr:MAG: hypothetical protein ACD_47C00159G0001 [uncultured bacterium]
MSHRKTSPYISALKNINAILSAAPVTKVKTVIMARSARTYFIPENSGEETAGSSGAVFKELINANIKYKFIESTGSA